MNTNLIYDDPCGFALFMLAAAVVFGLFLFAKYCHDWFKEERKRKARIENIRRMESRWPR